MLENRMQKYMIVIVITYTAILFWYNNTSSVRTIQSVLNTNASKTVPNLTYFQRRVVGLKLTTQHSGDSDQTRPQHPTTVSNRTITRYKNKQNNTLVSSEASIDQKDDDSSVWNQRRPEYCNPTGIIRKNGFHVDRESISCKPTRASNTACKLAEKLYFQGQEQDTCGENRKIVNICERNDAIGSFECDFRDCRIHKKPKVIVWRTDDNDGKVKRHKLFESEKSLRHSLVDISASTVKEGYGFQGYGFLILQCVEEEVVTISEYDDDGGDDNEENSFIGQLLILPPTNDGPKPESNKKININIVLLDSTSRSHFYRSLPKTLQLIEKINSDPTNAAEILDFELFQAVNGHTNQNLYALFTGKRFSENATTAEKNIVRFDKFFKVFVDNGYITYYHDDMCYDQVWGIRMNLGNPGRWGKFKRLVKENYIRNTGKFEHCS